MSYLVRQGDKLNVATISSVVTKVRALATLRYRDGTYDVLLVSDFTPVSSRTAEYWASKTGAAQDGEVVALSVYLPDDFTAATVQRGQLLAKATIGADATSPVIAQGYIYDQGALTLGQHDDAGPGGGSGWQRIRALSGTAAPGTGGTVTLQTDFTIQRYKTLGLWYHADATVISRTVACALRSQGTFGLPTGFGAGGTTDTWDPAGSLTLTAGQDGLFYVDRTRSMRNTNGSLAVDSMASAPSPLPMDITDGDITAFTWSVTNGQVGDSMNVMALVEEWITF